MDIEFLDAVHASEVFKAFYWDSRAACDELKEGCPEFHIERFKYLEKPDDYLIVFDVVDELGISSEVLNVDGWSS